MNEIKILLVDDVANVRELTEGRIKDIMRRNHMKCTILHAHDSEESIVAYDKHKPDFVIMDIVLNGGRNGYETLKILKQKDPNLNAVVLSAYSIRDEVVKCIEEKLAYKTFTKPTRIDSILSFILEKLEVVK